MAKFVLTQITNCVIYHLNRNRMLQQQEIKWLN